MKKRDQLLYLTYFVHILATKIAYPQKPELAGLFMMCVSSALFMLTVHGWEETKNG